MANFNTSAFIAVICFFSIVLCNHVSNVTLNCNGNFTEYKLPYTILRQLPDEIEERYYPPKVLPSYRSVRCTQLIAAMRQSYYHLLMYSKGRYNKDCRCLTTGLPEIVELDYVKDVEPKCSWILTTLLPVREADLPKPINLSVQLKKLSENNFYVSRFSGDILRYELRLLEMREKLNIRKLCYNPKKYFIASMTTPGELVERRNEIWIPSRVC